ncbi:CIC11C00000002577 [Sungouiella intermedia]|uniref:CIC11C00000002577 n=1 Tax=Sungouiella intermedia TaxID=45354 RepID=A0A1L0D853_9ASCO|nr:CIC11C00000002577 [[Candida] intermedia]
MLFAYYLLPLVVSAIITCDVQLKSAEAEVSKRDVENVNYNIAWHTTFKIGSENKEIPISFSFRNNVNSVSNYTNLGSWKLRYNSTLGDTIVTDKLTLGDYEVDDVEFITTEGNGTFGSLGLGLPYTGTWGYHKNFVQQLHENGDIESSVLSLWVNPGNTTEGQFAFGGIDEAKYDGSLFRFPMVNSFSYLEHSQNMEIKLDSLSASAVSFTQPVGVGLNPGMLKSSLPQGYFDAFGKALGGKFDKAENKYSVDKKYLTLNETVNFIFGNFNLSVPISSLVEESLGKVYATITANYIPVFGLDILQHAYIAIDYDNSEIALGQSKASALDSEKFVNATSNLDTILLASGASETSLAIEIVMALQSLAQIQYASQRSAGSLSGGAASAGPVVGLFGLIAGVLMAI